MKNKYYKLMIILILLAHLGACASTGFISSSASKQNLLLLEAEKKYQAGEYEQAKVLFEKISRRSSKGSAEAEFRLGNIAMHNNDAGEAITRYKNALQINPELSKVHYNLATAYLTQSEQHFHYFSATSGEDSQYEKLYELMGAIEKFSSLQTRPPEENTDPLDGLAEMLANKKDL